MLRHPKIRARVTATAAIGAAILATALYGVLLLLVRQQDVADLEKDLAREGRRVVSLIHSGVLNDGRIFTGGGDLLQTVGPDGRVVGTSPAMQGYPPVDFGPPSQDDDRLDGRSCKINAPGADCFLVVEYRVDTRTGPWYVFALAPEPGLMPRPAVAALMALGIPAIAGLVGLGTWLSAGRTLRPVEEIRREMDEITATDLERRVPVPDRRDEVSRLAESVNSTLDRLEAAVARQRGFVSDVSHELRSPLTGLRMELELALSDPDAGDLRDTLAATLKNADRLQAVVEDLLALARLDSEEKLRVEPVDLLALIDQEVLRRPRRVRLTVVAPEPVVVQGARLELARLLTNLIDNADRHADAAATVRLGIRPAGFAIVEVVDDGSGVLPRDRERIFERFTRLAEGRHRDAGGTGLGLAIARDIAVAHNGSLTITDREDGRNGARFVLLLPLEPPGQ